MFNLVFLGCMTSSTAVVVKKVVQSSAVFFSTVSSRHSEKFAVYYFSPDSTQYQSPSADKYSSEISAVHQTTPHNNTVEKPKEKSIYVGEKCRMGNMHGHGVRRYACGMLYNGKWDMNKRHGHGYARYAKGDVYKGEWKADKKEGHGVMKYANGDIYEGMWREDKRHGWGKMKYANGTELVIEWCCDEVIEEAAR